ncbi:hypothetical protein LEP1GSC165_1868 [Leptospira santarosai str. CBC523]|nr:hypothetical protein LEP1GSC165_1868 [Leptospira santarosai str. CBC523]
MKNFDLLESKNCQCENSKLLNHIYNQSQPETGCFVFYRKGRILELLKNEFLNRFIIYESGDSNNFT